MSKSLEPVDSVPPKSVDPIDNLTENIQLFWFKYQPTIYTCVVIVLLAVIGNGLWKWNKERVEKAIGAEYAAAGESLDKLRAFTQAHEGHELSGAAFLRIADESYTLGKAAEAVKAYEQAVLALKGSPYGERARLGLAVSQLLAGNKAEGEAGLRSLAEDGSAFKAIRAESAFHLAVVAADAGRPDEARKLCALLLSVDGTGLWAQRGFALQSGLPEEAAPAQPAVVEEAPALKLSLPSQ